MDFLDRINETMDFIENNLANEISYERVAQIACCSMHQFGRVFSYVVGTSLSEYVRHRRLTLAAFELQNSSTKIIDIALRYGYDSPNSFTRAFAEMHNVTPSEARTKGVMLKSYPRLSFHISIKGDVEMNYRIEEKGELSFVVRTKKIVGDNEGSIWNEFYSDGTNERIRNELKLCRSPYWHVGIYRVKQDNSVELSLGAESDGNTHDGLETLKIPPKTWAVFTVNGVGKAIGEMWTRIVTEWLPTSGYKHINDYEIEVFPDGDTNSHDYKSEIWIPVTKTNCSK